MAETIVVDGLRELRRDLRRLAPAIDKEVTKEVKRSAEVVARDARRRAPRSHLNKRHLVDTIKTGMRGGDAIVRATAPYARVVHFGGVVRPHGAAIRFRARPFLYDARDARAGEYLDNLEAGLARVFARHGWR